MGWNINRAIGVLSRGKQCFICNVFQFVYEVQTNKHLKSPVFFRKDILGVCLCPVVLDKHEI